MIRRAWRDALKERFERYPSYSLFLARIEAFPEDVKARSRELSSYKSYEAYHHRETCAQALWKPGLIGKD